MELLQFYYSVESRKCRTLGHRANQKKPKTREIHENVRKPPKSPYLTRPTCPVQQAARTQAKCSQGHCTGRSDRLTSFELCHASRMVRFTTRPTRFRKCLL